MQSDSGELKSIEDYMKGLTTNTYKLMMSDSQFNVKADGSFSPEFISTYAYKVQGENLTKLSSSERVKVLVTKGKNSLPIRESPVTVIGGKWNLWARKENMNDVFNVDLFISDKLVDKQEIHVVTDGRNGVPEKNAVVRQTVFSTRDITDKQGETSKLMHDRTVGESTTQYNDNPAYHSFDQLRTVIIDGATGEGEMVLWKTDLNVADLFMGESMTVRLMDSKTGELLVQDTIFSEAKSGRDAVTHRLISMQEATVTYKAKGGESLIRLPLARKIQEAVGEVTRELALGGKGIKLSVAGTTKAFVSTGGVCVLDKKDAPYREQDIETYTVTLTKESNIVDKRIVSITFKPKVVFDIDAKSGETGSDIINVEDNINSFKATIKEASSTMGNLKEQYSQMKIRPDEVNPTVNNDIRPNLLWGNDLGLSDVQDKIQLAYDDGKIIEQETAEREGSQRQLDTTSTSDTIKRDDLQEKINVCNDSIATVKKNVSECKATIEKHSRVGLASTRIDNEEWFEYQGGRDVGGDDATKFRTLAGVSEYPGLSWEKQAGAKCNIRLKPRTTYTLSAQIKVEFDEKVNGYIGLGLGVFRDENSMSGRRPNNASRLNSNKNPVFSNPADGWIRLVRTFATDDLNYDSMTMNIYDMKPAILYLCHPKLEKDNEETLWCVYDSIVGALLANGFSFRDKEFTATPDSFRAQNSKDDQIFLVDENGHINVRLIPTESIAVQKITQLFAEQQSLGTLMKNPPLSWHTTKSDNISGGYALTSEFNGIILNIYNHAAGTINLYSTLAVEETTYSNKTVDVPVELEPGTIFRAFSVSIKGVETIIREETTIFAALVPLVPIELTKLDGDMRANYIGAIEGPLTTKQGQPPSTPPKEGRENGWRATDW